MQPQSQLNQPDTEILRRADLARTKIDQLDTDATKAEAGAAAALERFERAPTSETALASTVAAQQAKNARAAHAAYAQQSEPLLAESLLRTRTRRLAELAPRLESAPLVDAAGDRIAELFKDFDRSFRSEISALARGLRDFNEAAREANELEAALEVPLRNHPHIKLSRIAGRLRGRVVARMGDATRDDSAADLAYSGGPFICTFRITCADLQPDLNG